MEHSLQTPGVQTSLSIRRILLATDLSPVATSAQRYAFALANFLGAELFLLHVLPDQIPGGTSDDSWFAPPKIPPLQIIDEAYAQMDLIVAAAELHVPHLQLDVRFGNTVEQIIRFAAETHIDLIVMGTHGRTGLPHAVIGSVAEKVVRMATCPVLTLHPEATVSCPAASQILRTETVTP